MNDTFLKSAREREREASYKAQRIAAEAQREVDRIRAELKLAEQNVLEQKAKQNELDGQIAVRVALIHFLTGS